MKNPIEIQLPGSNCLFIVLGMEESRDGIPSALLDDLPLNLAHSSAIGELVGQPLEVCIVVPAHVVNC